LVQTRARILVTGFGGMNGELLCLAKAGLHLDEALTVRFYRSENALFVAKAYCVDIERETDVFNSFIRVRQLHEKAEAEVGNPPIAIDDEDTLERIDVERLVALLCGGSEVSKQIRNFMGRFDPDRTGVVTRSQFHAVLEEECSYLKLNLCERIFLTFDEPTTSRLSLYVAISVMVLILISSIGFILATEEQFLEKPGNDYKEPPREIYFLQMLEAYCIYVFTVEYFARGLTVFAVRMYLKEPSLNFTIIRKKSIIPRAVDNEPTPMETDGTMAGMLKKSASSVDSGALKSQDDPSPQTESDTSPSEPRRGSWIMTHGLSMSASSKIEPEVEEALLEPAQVLSVKMQLERLHPTRRDNGFVRTWNYLTTNMNLIDAIAIAPFYLEALFGVGAGGLAFLRILRLARVFRLFKFGHLNEGVTLLGNVIRQSYPSLKLLAFFAMIGTVLYGSIIYLCEQGTWHGPEDGEEGKWKRPNPLGTGTELTPFLSIPRSMWWVMVTATTVGYGDMVPTTPFGKVVASLTMVSGVMVLALPITIISSNFTNEYEKLEDLKAQQRLSKATKNMNSLNWNEQKASQLFRNPDAGSPGDWSVLRQYKGNVGRRLERHLEMLLRGARIIALIGKLERRGAVSEAGCVAITREILSLMYRACAKGATPTNDLTDGGGSLNSSDVDAAVQVVLMWFRRMFQLDSHKHPRFKNRRASESSLPYHTPAPMVSPQKPRRSSASGSINLQQQPRSPQKKSRRNSLDDNIHTNLHRRTSLPMKIGEHDFDDKHKKPVDSILAGLGQFPSAPPTEEEEHEMRIAFMNFIIKVIPPVSSLTVSSAHSEVRPKSANSRNSQKKHKSKR